MTHQADPSPSPNAPFVYFSAFDTRCSQTFYCLYRSGIDGSAPELLGALFAPDGSRERVLTPDTRTCMEAAISWSSDSKWLLARSDVGVLNLIEVATGIELPLAYTGAFSSGSLK